MLYFTFSITLMALAIMIIFLIKKPNFNLFRLLLIIEVIVVMFLNVLVEVAVTNVETYNEVNSMIIVATIIGVCESAILLTLVISWYRISGKITSAIFKNV